MGNNAPAVSYALDLLTLLCESAEPMALSEISRQMNLNKSMVSRILSTLAENNWVTREEGKHGRYRLTLKPFSLFSNALQNISIYASAFPVLHEIWKATKKTVYLGVLKDDKVCYVQVIESTKNVRVASAVGAEYPLHCTAPGKVLLAHMDEKFLQEYIEKGLQPNTKNTITEERAFLAELDKVRNDGYALDNEEYANGIVCCAAPVFDYTNKIQGVIGVTSSTVYGDAQALLQRTKEQVVNGAAKLSAYLGRD